MGGDALLRAPRGGAHSAILPEGLGTKVEVKGAHGLRVRDTPWRLLLSIPPLASCLLW